MMSVKIKATKKLYLLVIVLSGFIVGIGLYGNHELRTMNKNTQTLYADRVFPMDQLGDVRFFYSSILATAEQGKDHQISFVEAVKKIQQSEDSINTNWKAYQLTYLTPDEVKLAKQENELINRSKKTVEKLKATFVNADTTALDNIVNKELSASIDPVISKLTELINLQVKVSGELYKNNNDAYEASLTKFLFSIIISLVFAIPFSYFLIKNVKGLINDIRESNRKIKEAEEKCRAFIKYAGDSIFILDQKLKITDVNDSACELVNYTHDELLQMKISDLVILVEKDSFAKRVDIVNKERGSLHERKWRRKDGSEVNTEVNVRVLEGVGYISIVRDITERKKTELEIKRSEEKYRYLFQNNPAYIIIWDLENLNVLEVNNAVLEKYGYQRDEWVGMSVLQYRPQDDHEKIKEFAMSMLNGQEPVSKRSWKHLKKNGEEMQMEITSHKIIYNDHNSILSLARDVTEQVRAENALQKSEEKFHSLVDHAADAIFMISDDTLIFDVNRSAADLLYYTREELIGKKVLDLHPLDEHENIPQVWDNLRKNKFLLDERRLLRKDGSTVEVEISRKMLSDGSGAIAIVRDITARKKAEEHLKLQNEKLREIAFLQSHIVRRPVASLLGLISLLEKDNPSDPVNFEVISKIEIVSKELDDVIHQIMQNIEKISK